MRPVLPTRPSCRRQHPFRIVHPFPPTTRLVHDLAPVFAHLATIPTRRALRRDPLYRAHLPEISRLLGALEWSLSRRSPPNRPLRAVAWNIERGKRLPAIAGHLSQHPRLHPADLILLTEVDMGMGRSHNENVARHLANRLDMDYVFVAHEIVLAPGDAFEQDHGRPNTLALHGSALLSRLPIRRTASVALPEFTDKFEVLEKRLGGKRALLCEVETAEGPLLVVVVHLDPFAPPRHRARQMRLVLAAADRFGVENVLLGGDLNTNTYALGSRLELFVNVAEKFLRFGFDGTIRQYMTPDAHFERGTFRALAEAGFSVDPFNDRSRGTCAYDVSDPELWDWTRRYVPKPLAEWLAGRLAPYGGRVPLRLDWFAGRGLAARQAAVVEGLRDSAGNPVSDHDPLVLEFERSAAGSLRLAPTG